MDWLAGSTGRWFGGLRLVACRARYLRSSCCPGSISGRGNKGKGEPKGTQPGGQADHSITSSAHTDVLGPARPVPLSGPRGKRGGQTPRWPRLTERDVGCLLRVSRFGDDRECPDVARNRLGAMSALQPLSGGKRTHCGHVATAVFDPTRTLGGQICCDAEYSTRST